MSVEARIEHDVKTAINDVGEAARNNLTQDAHSGHLDAQGLIGVPKDAASVPALEIMHGCGGHGGGGNHGGWYPYGGGFQKPISTIDANEVVVRDGQISVHH
jgi:hypothetical protein